MHSHVLLYLPFILCIGNLTSIPVLDQGQLAVLNYHTKGAVITSAICSGIKTLAITLAHQQHWILRLDLAQVLRFRGGNMALQDSWTVAKVSLPPHWRDVSEWSMEKRQSYTVRHDSLPV